MAVFAKSTAMRLAAGENSRLALVAKGFEFAAALAVLAFGVALLFGARRRLECSRSDAGMNRRLNEFILSDNGLQRRLRNRRCEGEPYSYAITTEMAGERLTAAGDWRRLRHIAVIAIALGGDAA